jgi:hypothetical protein
MDASPFEKLEALVSLETLLGTRSGTGGDVGVPDPPPPPGRIGEREDRRRTSSGAGEAERDCSDFDIVAVVYGEEEALAAGRRDDRGDDGADEDLVDEACRVGDNVASLVLFVMAGNLKEDDDDSNSDDCGV